MRRVFTGRLTVVWVLWAALAALNAGVSGWACIYVPISELAGLPATQPAAYALTSETAALTRLTAATIALGCGSVGLWVGLALWVLLGLKRARVTVDEDGMAVVDWRGRERRMSWSETVGMRVVQLGSRPGSCVIRLADGRQRVGIPTFLDKREALIALVASQAGLERQERWFGYTCQRRGAM